MVKVLVQVHRRLLVDLEEPRRRIGLPRTAHVHGMVVLFHDHLQHRFQLSYSLSSVLQEVFQQECEPRRKAR